MTEPEPGRYRRPPEPRAMPRLLVMLLLAVTGLLAVTWMVTSPDVRPEPTRPSDIPVAGLESSLLPLGTPPQVPAGTGGYTFNMTWPDGVTPVTWDPCRPIHFVVSGEGPEGGARMIKKAVAAISGATGLKFIYDGTSPEQAVVGEREPYLPELYGPRWAPVLIAWTSPRQRPDLDGEILGLGGGLAFSYADLPPTYVSGSMYLDADSVAQLAASDRAAAQAVVTHELAHVVGLGHVNDAGQLMYPQTGVGVTKLQDGDLRGLAVLGAGPCQPEL